MEFAKKKDDNCYYQPYVLSVYDTKEATTSTNEKSISKFIICTYVLYHLHRTTRKTMSFLSEDQISLGDTGPWGQD